MEMASIFELYILFSLTTAIVGLIQIYAPVHKKLKDKQINNLASMSPVMSCLIFGTLGFITSPLLFAVLMRPSVANTFITAMYDTLASHQK